MVHSLNPPYETKKKRKQRRIFNENRGEISANRVCTRLISVKTIFQQMKQKKKKTKQKKRKENKEEFLTKTEKKFLPPECA